MPTGSIAKTFIEYDLRLSIALRYLAGGSYLDLMYLHGVGKSSVFHLLYDDVPEDLVPNRTDLAAGPRQALTDRLDGMGICRPNLRLWGR